MLPLYNVWWHIFQCFSFFNLTFTGLVTAYFLPVKCHLWWTKYLALAVKLKTHYLDGREVLSQIRAQSSLGAWTSKSFRPTMQRSCSWLSSTLLVSQTWLGFCKALKATLKTVIYSEFWLLFFPQEQMLLASSSCVLPGTLTTLKWQLSIVSLMLSKDYESDMVTVLRQWSHMLLFSFFFLHSCWLLCPQIRSTNCSLSCALVIGATVHGGQHDLWTFIQLKRN